jgi:hypothetical protein
MELTASSVEFHAHADIDGSGTGAGAGGSGPAVQPVTTGEVL